MFGSKTIYVGLALLPLLYLGWKFTARSAYEAAEYKVVESEGRFETRQYSALDLVVTNMEGNQGEDGSFMRLFRYISGKNDQKQKVAMTVPVFMEPTGQKEGQMAFVLPREVAEQGAPTPTAKNVSIGKRAAGVYAVVRFSGRLDRDSEVEAEKELRDWIQKQGWTVVGEIEFAGYDPPWTPGLLRRNEALLKIK